MPMHVLVQPDVCPRRCTLMHKMVIWWCHLTSCKWLDSRGVMRSRVSWYRDTRVHETIYCTAKQSWIIFTENLSVITLLLCNVRAYISHRIHKFNIHFTLWGSQLVYYMEPVRKESFRNLSFSATWNFTITVLTAWNLNSTKNFEHFWSSRGTLEFEWLNCIFIKPSGDMWNYIWYFIGSLAILVCIVS